LKNRKTSNKSKPTRAEERSKEVGSLAGVSTLRRAGDTVVKTVGNHKILSSRFAVGPFHLEMVKQVGY